MKEIIGNLFDYSLICITTNGTLKTNGECVMGRGVALDAAKKWPDLPALLGNRIAQRGNKVFFFPQFGVYTFPVKHHWKEKADLNLIEESAKDLVVLSVGEKVYIPRPGCGNGGLSWKDVKQVIAPILTDNIIVVHYENIED